MAHSESGLSSARIPSAVSEGTPNGPVFSNYSSRQRLSASVCSQRPGLCVGAVQVARAPSRPGFLVPILSSKSRFLRRRHSRWRHRSLRIRLLRRKVHPIFSDASRPPLAVIAVGLAIATTNRRVDRPLLCWSNHRSLPIRHRAPDRPLLCMWGRSCRGFPARHTQRTKLGPDTAA